MNQRVPTAHFDYDLPPELVAQQPVEPRDSARMLVALDEAKVEHATVRDLDSFLGAGDVLVVNNTRVIRARLRVQKPTGGAAEVLLLEPTKDDGWWEALVRPSKRISDGTVLEFNGEQVVEVGSALGDGRRLARVMPRAIELAGEIPLPPYIKEPLEDTERYQTVYADKEGSVAAPTAGLHLTETLLEKLKAKGVEVVSVELRVGLGTFQPITSEWVGDHPIHSEAYAVSEETWRKIGSAGRVVAVGTTVVRTLETVASTGELHGTSELYIKRGFTWNIVDVLLTNFHVPRSSLLVLVDAFIGARWSELYEEAKTKGYRFFSFGDCMLLRRNQDGKARD